MDLESDTWAQIPVSEFVNCETLSQFLKISVPFFSHSWNEDDNTTTAAAADDNIYPKSWFQD